MAAIDRLLRLLKDTGASDLHMATGQRPKLRVHGDLEDIPEHAALTEDSSIAYLQEICPPHRYTEWSQTHDADFAYSLAGVARFRCNYFQQHNGPGAVFRVIPEKIKTIADLHLPPIVESITLLKHGLVLVTGPTGSGKSTSLAAMIDHINTTQKKHIITIEDPLEFVHANKSSILTQREVDSHTTSFPRALKASLRQDPDIVLIGEMRDLETISLALTAAETGILVFGTLHTNSAPKTIDRIIDVFPPEQQSQVRTVLAEVLKAVVSQILLQTSDGKGRVAVNEILLSTSGMANVIREGNTPKIHNLIEAGRGEGMQTMDNALMAYLQQGKIKADDAYVSAHDKTMFERFLNP
ncbi:MAG: type IV pilus twitching motility protein PilT [Planctomycetes bacterium]|nr:type IV pilus twitching motility protein PilT [Planctomycetota bacterium]